MTEVHTRCNYAFGCRIQQSMHTRTLECRHDNDERQRGREKFNLSTSEILNRMSLKLWDTYQPAKFYPDRFNSLFSEYLKLCEP